MTEKTKFTTDAGLIDRLGRELVGRQETALIELVKNSYDADASEVTVTLEKDALVVEDNGTGMSRADLVDGFLRLASDYKIKYPRSKIYNRQRAGRKGIGRFSTQRLGSKLRLSTWTNDQDPGIELFVNWADFMTGLDLNDVPIYIREIGRSNPGTTIRIEDLRDIWSDAQMRRCWRGVLALQQPFAVGQTISRNKYDPGFSVQFIRENELFGDPHLVIDYQSEILAHSHAVIELRVNTDGVAEWRISQNHFGPDRPWSQIHHLHRDDGFPPRYVALRNIAMKAHYFILAPELLPAFAFSRVRDALRREGGIRLYRNGFRVVPYGEDGDDWLRLDQIYAQRGIVLSPFASRNFFGVIEVRDPEGTQFEEHTSREGLIETESFRELTELATAVLITAVNKIAEDRGRKTSAGGSTQRKAADNLGRLHSILLTTKAAAEKNQVGRNNKLDFDEKPPSLIEGNLTAEADDQANQSENALDYIKESIDLIEKQQAELADEAALLRLLATLGLTTSEFSHETGMTFEAVRMDFKAVFEVALNARTGDNEFSSQAERARTMLARLDALTAYLNELASARSIRQLAPVSVTKAIEDFENGIKKLAEKASINLEISVPDFDPLFTKPMHAAEVSSVLLNFFSNSLKALRRTPNNRRIFVEANREEDNIIIRFSDSGDGIPIANREKVFNLFFTTRVAASANASGGEQFSGTGLGLWIVHQIISKVGGDVEVVDAAEGFTTCIEVLLPANDEE